MKQLFIVVLSGLLLSGCASQSPSVLKSATYQKLYEEKPLSILVMPPINRSTKVEAKELFYSSLAVPLSLKGYYVMPPLLTMDILKEESAYDSEMFLGQSTKKMGEYFGADAVLFTIIHDWRKTAIASQVNVKIEYLMKSTKTDEVLFNRTGTITLNISMNTGNILVNLIGSMVATALTKEIVVGRNCNYYTLEDLPAGQYHSQFGLDGDTPAQAKEFETVLNNEY